MVGGRLRYIDVRIWVYRRLCSLLPVWAGRRLVGWLLGKARRLGLRGLAPAAVAAAEEAVREGARIASVDPESYSAALGVLAQGLLGQGRCAEAVVVSDRMVAFAAEAGAVPAVAERMMGWALEVRSSVLQTQGGQDEALADAVEAVRLFRAGTSTQPRRCRPGLAAALLTLGHRYTEHGQHRTRSPRTRKLPSCTRACPTGVRAGGAWL